MSKLPADIPGVKSDLTVFGTLTKLVVGGQIPFAASESIKISVGPDSNNLILWMEVRFDMESIDIYTKRDGKWSTEIKKDNPYKKGDQMRVTLTATPTNYVLEILGIKDKMTICYPPQSDPPTLIWLDNQLHLNELQVATK
ncbi:hypothetical protein AALO_G00118720 [Alosa alosa]|uniref:Galectin domain-containing protein n=1 Tax=Alosa alosa TaxID=278164 RepID=A0AAV6GQR4_9TELE|nr:hypothetical protein AALO_G00118720 [Alosa alosa]